MKKIIPLCLLVSLCSCAHKKYASPHVLIDTGMGDIEVELYPDKAPKTVAAFLSFVDAGYYKKASFYRVLKDDDMPADYSTGLIQGGTWPKDMHVPGVTHESTKLSGLSHTNGMISLASAGAGTAGTEFFICIGDQTQLDAGRKGTTDGLGYAAFGRVVQGMDVVRKIQSQRSTGDRFDERIIISGMKVL